MNPTNQMLSPKELAAYLRVATHTLSVYRMCGTGPKYIKLGRIIRYKFNDVLDWIDKKSAENKHLEM